MNNRSFGRPTQVHSVPPEERAIDSKGNRLPWALEWHEDHPNARSQRRQIEEKGPFGKSTRRKASSRTRTATPAKKENPSLEGFDQALRFDAARNAQSPQATLSARAQSDGVLPTQHSLSAEKQPTQVSIYGYYSESQWAALEGYEKASGGMICEDYEREPPNTKKYPSAFSSSRSRRALTKAEKEMALRYHGGYHWIKVTFDSAEAADRAVESSPIKSMGHWVYAQLYHGNGPDQDEPIPISGDEIDSRTPKRKPYSMGNSAGYLINQRQDGAVQTHASLVPSTQTNGEDPHGVSPSSTTATSATATGIEYPDLRQRQASAGQHTGEPSPGTLETRRTMQHFPDLPRTILRPASEAFLPQPTWWERQMKTLADMGLIPGEVIGNGIPRKIDGTLDLGRASLYWKFFYWIDSHFGTDLCGLKDDE